MTSYIDPSQKLFHHLDKLTQLQRGETPTPINIEIDLSNRCSLGCEWCHFAYTHTRGPLKGSEKPAGAVAGGDLMEVGLAKRIIDEFDQAGVKSVTWTGGGEPTLHPDFDAIIQYTYNAEHDYPEGDRADRRYGRIRQGVYTNGAHITTERAALLKRAMTFVYVSLDAADAADYKRDKRVQRFDEVCAGVQRLVEAQGDAVIGLGFLLTKQNWRRHLDMLMLGRSLGASYVQFRPTILYDHAAPAANAEDSGWMREALPTLEHLHGMRGVEIDLARFHRLLNWHGHGYQTCYWSVLQSVVTPNGKMWTCVNKREHPAEELGDLSTESFANIWSRHTPVQVSERCRLLCRGDVANQTLDRIYEPVQHPEFV